MEELISPQPYYGTAAISHPINYNDLFKYTHIEPVATSYGRSDNFEHITDNNERLLDGLEDEIINEAHEVKRLEMISLGFSRQASIQFALSVIQEPLTVFFGV